MTSPSLWAVRSHLQRVTKPRGSGVASADEAAAAARRGVQGFATDFLGWRRSALVITTIVVLAGAVAMTIDISLRWDHLIRHRTLLGIAVDIVGLRLITPWVVGVLCAAAALSWTRLRVSFPLVVAAATIEIVPPFLAAMVPPHWMHVAPNEAAEALMSRATQVAIAAGLALRLIGLLSAGFRAAVVSKFLLPESPVPGATIAALLPINLGFAVAGYVAINAMVHGWALLGAWLCLVVYQLLYVARGTALLHPQEEVDAARAFVPAMRGKLVLLPLMAVLMGIFLFTSHNSLDRPIVDAHWLRHHWVFLIGIFTNYALTLVVGVDLFMHGVARLSARRRGAVAERHLLEERLVAKATSIVEAGGGEERSTEAAAVPPASA